MSDLSGRSVSNRVDLCMESVTCCVKGGRGEGGWLLPAPNGELPCGLWIGGPVRSTWGSIYQFQMFRNFETLIELASLRGPRVDPVHGIQ